MLPRRSKLSRIVSSRRNWGRRSRRAPAGVRPEHWLRALLHAIVWLAAAGACATSLTLASVFLYLDPQIPSTDTYRQYSFETPLRIYTADGLLVGEFGDRRLIPIALEDVPRHFIAGLINTEDKRFYEHRGIDFISLANDVVALATSDVRTGASTLTMQLAKVVSFSHRQQFIRKFKEMLLATKVEQELDKDEILELYVNVMAFGKHAYGVQAAAHTYYGKPVAELNLAQQAMLAGIIKKPEAGNPINGPTWALERRNLVLRRMRQQGAISDAEYESAVRAPITAEVFQRGIDLPAPYPAEWVRQELFSRYGANIYSGFVAHTTLDSGLQQAAQSALRRGLVAYDRRHRYRGPEGRVSLVRKPDGSVDLAATANALGGRRAIHGLLPAAVVENGADAVADCNDEGAVEDACALHVVRRNGETVAIPWAGLRWARRHLDTDRFGPPPERPADIAATGDVVRMEMHQSGWRLAQLPAIDGALVAVDANSGGVRALVGGWDFHSRQFNHARQARRQPGSGFKPFVYSAALENGVTPATVFWDTPLTLTDNTLETVYRPRNDSGDFRGPMALRQALYQSRNLVSIKLMMQVGAGPIIDHVRRFGFDPATLPRNTQLAIGGGTMALTPLDMASAYAVLANGGFKVEPHIVQRVERLDGTVLLRPRHPAVCRECAAVPTEVPAAAPRLAAGGAPALGDDAPPPAERVVDERNTFVMHSLLRDVVERGTGRRARALGRPDIVGKTGTTDDATDTWFNGYHPNLAVSVWVGFADRRPLGEAEYGSNTPLPIWIDFMRVALADEPVVARPMPAGVVSVKVAQGGERRAGDAGGAFEYFFAENVPPAAIGPGARTETPRSVRPEDLF